MFETDMEKTKEQIKPLNSKHSCEDKIQNTPKHYAEYIANLLNVNKKVVILGVTDKIS